MAAPLRVVASSLFIALVCGAGGVCTAFAQANNDPAPGKNANGPARAAPGDAAAQKPDAAQRARSDERRLLGVPQQKSPDGYGANDASPDAQRDALMSEERMRVARPSDMIAGGTAGGGYGAAPGAAGGAARRAPRAGQKAAGPTGALNAGTAAVDVYRNPYTAGGAKGAQPYRSPW